VIDLNAPNLAGDNVRFVRYENGLVKNWGHMHVEHIEALKAQGEDIVIVPFDWVPPIVEPDFTPHIKFAIVSTLTATDKYFTADAEDNITPAAQAEWRKYRRKLRDAYKNNDAPDIVAALPGLDPYGKDPFKDFR
jgi:hypothetical protein